MSRDPHRRSLDDLGVAETPPSGGSATPATPPDAVTSPPPDPIDLSASSQALEERQIRWIRLRERWVRRRSGKKEADIPAVPSVEDSSAPPPGP